MYINLVCAFCKHTRAHVEFGKIVRGDFGRNLPVFWLAYYCVKSPFNRELFLKYSNEGQLEMRIKFPNSTGTTKSFFFG